MNNFIRFQIQVSKWNNLCQFCVTIYVCVSVWVWRKILCMSLDANGSTRTSCLHIIPLFHSNSICDSFHTMHWHYALDVLSTALSILFILLSWWLFSAYNIKWITEFTHVLCLHTFAQPDTRIKHYSIVARFTVSFLLVHSLMSHTLYVVNLSLSPLFILQVPLYCWLKFYKCIHLVLWTFVYKRWHAVDFVVTWNLARNPFTFCN